MNPGDRDRLRATLARVCTEGLLPDVTAEHPGRFVQPVDATTPAALLDRFTREFESLAGRLHRAAGVVAVVAIVKGIAREHDVRSFLAWRGDDLVDEVSSALEREGLVRVRQEVPNAGDERAASLAEIGACSLGITGAEFGLADTGSVVLASGPGRGRLASLLPPVHIVLIRRERIVASLAHAFARDPALPARGSNLVVITGPSRTADIEFTLSRGVHGPGQIHVVVAD